jgi:hypothetical protein
MVSKPLNFGSLSSHIRNLQFFISGNNPIALRDYTTMQHQYHPQKNFRVGGGKRKSFQPGVCTNYIVYMDGTL